MNDDELGGENGLKCDKMERREENEEAVAFSPSKNRIEKEKKMREEGKDEKGKK